MVNRKINNDKFGNALSVAQRLTKHEDHHKTVAVDNAGHYLIYDQGDKLIEKWLVHGCFGILCHDNF